METNYERNFRLLARTLGTVFGIIAAVSVGLAAAKSDVFFVAVNTILACYWFVFIMFNSDIKIIDNK